MFIFTQEEKSTIIKFMETHSNLHLQDLIDVIIHHFKYDRDIRAIVMKMQAQKSQITFGEIASSFRKTYMFQSYDSEQPKWLHPPRRNDYDLEPQCHCDSKMLVSYGHENHCEYKHWKDRQRQKKKNPEESQESVDVLSHAVAMQAYVDILAGAGLDHIGQLLAGVARSDSETDASYRARIIEKIKF